MLNLSEHSLAAGSIHSFAEPYSKVPLSTLAEACHSGVPRSAWQPCGDDVAAVQRHYTSGVETQHYQTA